LRSLSAKRPERIQQFLKSASGAAGAEVVASELFDELLVAVHDAVAAPDVGLRGITLASAYA
jgi:hypothetical protein